jgi:hypothetical protein
MFYSDVTNPSFPRECSVKKLSESWIVQKPNTKRKNQCLEKEIFIYHTLRKNTEEGNLNFRVAEDGLPALREILSSPA